MNYLFKIIILNDSSLFEQIIQLKSELDREKNRLKIMEKQIPNSIDLYNHIYDSEKLSKNKYFI